MDILEVDNTAVRVAQVQRRTELKLRVTQAASSARWRRSPPRPATAGALLDLPSPPRERRATLGEISDAMEAVFGRHQAHPHDRRRVSVRIRRQPGRSRKSRNDDAFAAAKAAGPGSTSPSSPGRTRPGAQVFATRMRMDRVDIGSRSRPRRRQARKRRAVPLGMLTAAGHKTLLRQIFVAS